MAQKLLCFFYTVILFCLVLSQGFDEDINVDYILRPDLMPGFLLMLDADTDFSPFINISGKGSSVSKQGTLSSNGSWYDAYSTMGFHRKMLNEYLCRNFLADEILSQIQRPLITHKVGRPFSKVADGDQTGPNGDQMANRKSRADVADIKDNLLSDPGSSNYRDWLSKTATLEDVYRHYDMAVSRGGEESDEEEYEGGEFTGYAMPGPAPHATEYSQHPGGGGGGGHHPAYGAGYIPQPVHHGESPKYGGGGYDYAPHHVHYHDSEKSSHNGLALNDMFDLALTALAFLSFGMFILQVIMCITASKPAMPMMQMTDTDGDQDPVDEIRFRRETSSSLSSTNELSRRVLTSIEAGVEAEQDQGACLRWSLCDNNSYSRGLDDSQKIWIPVWGLGMSWLSSRLIRGPPSSSAMLESLRACALGLARADCSSLYSECNFRHLLANRKTVRRRARTVASSGSEKKGDDG